MGDRGGTATWGLCYVFDTDYTRWEIGGEPQHVVIVDVMTFIIPDGRSGGNRNLNRSFTRKEDIIPDGRSGGNRNTISERRSIRTIIPDGRSGGNRNYRRDKYS